jgi:uridine kinase
MKLNKKLFSNIKKKEINFIIVDGITCSGKSLFADLLKKNLKDKFPDILTLSKDLFLYPREKRIKITRNLRKIKKNQNELHYDLKKLKLLLEFLNGNNKAKTIVLKNLYNRKTGKNNLKIKFRFLKKRLIIFEGIYVSEDIRYIIKPIFKILIIEKVYESLARKIERIRDKKISVQLVVTEFIKIHLESFKKYLNKNNFDISFEDIDRNFVAKKQGKAKQLEYIKKFLLKHRY